MSIIGLSSIFSVPNIEKTAEYYKECLGFSAVEYLNCEEKHICLYRDKIEIILLQAKPEKIMPNRKLYGYGYDAYLYADNQEDLQQEFLSKGVKIARPLNLTDYQNKEFVIEDTDVG